MDMADEKAWNEYVTNNQDPYGKACVEYAKRWAEEMEKRMSEGATVTECASDASRVADTEGITGFMYGCAVSMLARCWKHGETLRRWHNKDVQISNEGDKANESGGVLNPALFSIG